MLLNFDDREDPQHDRPTQEAFREAATDTARLALDAQPEKLAGLVAFGARRSLETNALLEISALIHSPGGLAAVERRLMTSIFDITPAQRGAILLLSKGEAEFASAYGWTRDSGMGPVPSVSRPAVERAIHDRVSVLLDAKKRDTASSVVVVPLVSHGHALGVIALETDDPAAPFDEDHLRLLTAIAAIAAAALENALHMEWLENENSRLRAEINLQHNMIGDSQKICEILEQVARIAPSESTILVQGESGTGKELVARAVHTNSKRCSKPFVAINCATLVETLLESELFGHEKGAFTGAIAQKRGKIELAEGGTLFLDEIGELPSVLQAKLLRVLQEREFERVGGTRLIRSNVRLIAATNRDLKAAVESGLFRQDLFYRLNVITVTVPPLRERRDDIPLLASHFVARQAEKVPRKIAGISPVALACLMAYDWPGNVRELENAVERAVVMGSSELIQPDDLPEEILETNSSQGIPVGKYHEAVREEKRRLIVNAVEQSGGSHLQAAKLLNLTPAYLSRLIRNLDLKAVFKSGAGTATPASR